MGSIYRNLKGEKDTIDENEVRLMKQIEFLTSMLYSQLGITQSVMDVTAEEKAMSNYYYEERITHMLKEMIDILAGYAQEHNLEFCYDCDFDEDRKYYIFRFEDPVSHDCFRRCFSQQMLDVFAEHGVYFAYSVIEQLKLAFRNDY